MNELQLIWGWQPALYLFLGGMGAGAFVAAAVLFLVDREHNRKTIAASMWTAMMSLAVGLVLLLSELVFPARGLMLWQSFSNWTSWMTFGAWVAFAAIIMFVLTAALLTEKLVTVFAKKWKALPEKTSGYAKVLAIIGLVLGLCVAVYTGMLLMAVPGVPLWDTPLLPCLFTVSALDTGVALVEIISLVVAKREKSMAVSQAAQQGAVAQAVSTGKQEETAQVAPTERQGGATEADLTVRQEEARGEGLTGKARRLLEKAAVVLVVLESLVLVAFALVMLGGNGAVGDFPGSAAETAVASIGLLLSGPLALYFWILVVVCGLILPLAAAVYCLTRREKHPKGIVALGATGALVGGCALRFLILMAGLHADYVADMIQKFF